MLAPRRDACGERRLWPAVPGENSRSARYRDMRLARRCALKALGSLARGSLRSSKDSLRSSFEPSLTPFARTPLASRRSLLTARGARRSLVEASLVGLAPLAPRTRSLSEISSLRSDSARSDDSARFTRRERVSPLQSARIAPHWATSLPNRLRFSLASLVAMLIPRATLSRDETLAGHSVLRSLRGGPSGPASPRSTARATTIPPDRWSGSRIPSSVSDRS